MYANFFSNIGSFGYQRPPSMEWYNLVACNEQVEMSPYSKIDFPFIFTPNEERHHK